MSRHVIIVQCCLENHSEYSPVWPSVTQCVNSPSTRQARPGRVTSVTSHVPGLTPSWAPHFYTSPPHYLILNIEVQCPLW